MQMCISLKGGGAQLHTCVEFLLIQFCIKCPHCDRHAGTLLAVQCRQLGHHKVSVANGGSALTLPEACFVMSAMAQQRRYQ